MKQSCVATPKPTTRARCCRSSFRRAAGTIPRAVSARLVSSSASSHPVNSTAKTVPSTPPTTGIRLMSAESSAIPTPRAKSASPSHSDRQNE